MLITIIGSGSLLSHASAEKTCPSLTNFRLAKIDGYKRVFNKAHPLKIFNNDLPAGSNAYACLSLMPDNTVTNMIISTFDIHEEDWSAFVKREFDYKLENIPFKNIDGTVSKGIGCLGNINDEECEKFCRTDPERHKHWLQFKQLCAGPVWRTDLLPDEDYLAHCLSYCKEHGEDVYNNFMRTTFIGDGTVSIADYLKSKSTTATR